MKDVVKNIFWKVMVLLLMICGFLLFIHLVYGGSREYWGNSNKRLNIIISEEGVNRIGIEGDRIAKVVGNGEEYSIEGESGSGVIFITSKLRGGEVSPITIITEKGYVQDVNLKVRRGKEAKSILIKKPVDRGSKEKKESQERKEGIKRKAIEGIREISRGDTRNYSFRRIGIETVSKSREGFIYKGYQGLINSGVKVTRITEYTSRYLKIYKYEYEEKGGDLVLGKIAEIFGDSLGVSERGNGIYVIYIQ